MWLAARTSSSQGRVSRRAVFCRAFLTTRAARSPALLHCPASSRARREGITSAWEARPPTIAAQGGTLGNVSRNRCVHANASARRAVDRVREPSARALAAGACAARRLQQRLGGAGGAWAVAAPGMRRAAAWRAPASVLRPRSPGASRTRRRCPPPPRDHRSALPRRHRCS